jgi:hypothetical protein
MGLPRDGNSNTKRDQAAKNQHGIRPLSPARGNATSFRDESGCYDG